MPDHEATLDRPSEPVRQEQHQGDKNERLLCHDC